MWVCITSLWISHSVSWCKLIHHNIQASINRYIFSLDRPEGWTSSAFGCLSEEEYDEPNTWILCRQLLFQKVLVLMWRMVKNKTSSSTENCMFCHKCRDAVELTNEQCVPLRLNRTWGRRLWTTFLFLTTGNQWWCRYILRKTHTKKPLTAEIIKDCWNRLIL